MAIRYKDFDGEPVSIAWHRVLTRARQKGVKFTIRDGHRTMAEQAFLRRLYLAGRGALAAVPSIFAPHIRTGRPDHALDVGPDPASVQRLIRFLNSRGLQARLTVPGEWWHVEANPNRLVAFARRIARRFR